MLDNELLSNSLGQETSLSAPLNGDYEVTRSFKIVTMPKGNFDVIVEDTGSLHQIHSSILEEMLDLDFTIEQSLEIITYILDYFKEDDIKITSEDVVMTLSELKGIFSPDFIIVKIESFQREEILRLLKSRFECNIIETFKSMI